ncbi:MAG: hypothetical protein H0W61_13310 [Bacteroidetes bacterium]|nr:hypothetical protein [Bacteroidota bacterium]
MNSQIRKTIIWVSLFAIAMGFMESAVVIYLRELYYKTGFDFPLKIIPSFIGKVEFYRELGTVIMLVGIGIVAGKTKLQRFAYFVLAFAVWDIFYYIFLYVCLGWPQSLSTWDILFLIPVPWVGPVWAPCILSLLMITGSLFVIVQTETNKKFIIHPFCWWLLLSGAFVCILSFMWDYLSFAGSHHQTWSVFSSKDMFCEIENYVPTKFNTLLFFTGFFPMLASVCYSVFKSYKSQNQ